MNPSSPSQHALAARDVDPLQALTRRHFFGRCLLGLGGIALGSMLGGKKLFGADRGVTTNPMAPQKPMFAARAKNVIFLFMAGGPSQLELFDYKPKLAELNGQPIPQSFIEGEAVRVHGQQPRDEVPT